MLLGTVWYADGDGTKVPCMFDFYWDLSMRERERERVKWKESRETGERKSNRKGKLVI